MLDDGIDGFSVCSHGIQTEMLPHNREQNIILSIDIQFTVNVDSQLALLKCATALA
jgi:hypothetical protein